MTTQNDFTAVLFRPEKEDERLDYLLHFLDGRGWLTARQIKQATGLDDRTIRALAEASEGLILGGQKGYKLTRQATAEERDHAYAWLMSQGKKMIARATKIAKIHHQHNPAE